MAARESAEKIVATHRRARFDYEILERCEAGIALLGPEVKSLRAGKANLAEGYAHVRRGDVWLMGVHISPYAEAGRNAPEPRRERRLLLHRSEILRLQGKLTERGLTLIPLKLYFKNGRAKVELGVARGKRRYDKRESIRAREEDRDLRRVMRGRGRSRP